MAMNLLKPQRNKETIARAGDLRKILNYSMVECDYQLIEVGMSRGDVEGLCVTGMVSTKSSHPVHAPSRPRQLIVQCSQPHFW